jgi:arsenate reductase (thioredoxin)
VFPEASAGASERAGFSDAPETGPPTSDLQDEFAGTFSRETIARFIAESVDLLGESKINVFVPVLAHRFARERLKALGQAEGVITKEQPEVLFVCVQNAGRSQMAAGLLTLRSGGRVGVRSAGSDPGEIVNRRAAKAMAELGVDLEDAFPKPLTDEVVRAADVDVTMGCGDACPIYPGKRYEDREVGDPAAASSLDEVRSIRDDIDLRIQQLLSELGVPVVSKQVAVSR